MWLHLIRPRPPNAQKEFIKHPAANRIHRNLTSAGFSASSVEKYHYPLCLSSPPPEAIRLSLYKLYRSLPYRKVVARLHHGFGFPRTQEMYLMNVYSLFKGLRRAFLSSQVYTATSNEKNETQN